MDARRRRGHIPMKIVGFVYNAESTD